MVFLGFSKEIPQIISYPRASVRSRICRFWNQGGTRVLQKMTLVLLSKQKRLNEYNKGIQTD